MGKSRTRQPRPVYLGLAVWHRRIGLVAALLLAWLAISGVLLNHTETLGLDRRYVGAAWLLDWYGIEGPGEITGFRVGGHWLTQVGERLYWNDRPLPGEYRRLSGAVLVNGEIAAATAAEILLLTQDGRLAEILDSAHGVPDGIEQVGLDDGHLLVRTRERVYAAGTGMMRWRGTRPQDPEWARPTEVPEALRARLSADYRGRVLTLERVLLDLHSGRLPGPGGVVLMDLAAVSLLLLAGIGVWMWFVRNGNGHRPREPRGRG
jgi:uncharacterized iron-regulated membrane protein